VFDSSGWRYVAVCIAEGNRLIFEREWQLPADLGRDSLIPLLLDFMSDALHIALTQEPLSGGRRDAVRERRREYANSSPTDASIPPPAAEGRLLTQSRLRVCLSTMCLSRGRR